jgi:predicted ester cyclase
MKATTTRLARATIPFIGEEGEETPTTFHLNLNVEPELMDENAVAKSTSPPILQRGLRRLEYGISRPGSSPQFTSHDWPQGGPTGPQAFRGYYSALRSAVPDARYEVDDLIAEDDKVVVRWRLLGTHKGTFRGIAPTGRPIVLKGIAIYRVDGGKLMERWVVSDLYGVLEENRQPSPQ